ncbi:hypothetical protein Sps_01469 [Shewanella psychrophila]|uniref:Uncharacterized protein n=1 Tax=Shewanella psychrophila TaxID=225848 RepID=A0A1S6HM75_9GAMM|nr:contractile injection system tape measure protein [Shewanella psychrophila]AQS36635.1 hypothetical protein Sps_01469 [Shewanella psychrophila]
MADTLPVSTHRIDKLRISLSLAANHGEYFSQRCSQLFHTELKKRLDRVLSRLGAGGQMFCLLKPLVIDLGELSAYAFEHHFCQRLEILLERELKRLLSELDTDHDSAGKPVANTDEQLSLLTAGAVSSTSVIDKTFVELLGVRPQLALGKLAQACLEYSGARQLHRSLPASKFKELCQEWVPLLVVKGSLTPATLQLCALYYSLVHPEFTLLPHQPIVRPTVNTVYEQQVLIKLFKEVLSAKENMSVKANGLTVLWRDEKLRKRVQSQLCASQITLLNNWLNKGIVQESALELIDIVDRPIVNTEYGPVREKGQSPLCASEITLLNKGSASEQIGVVDRPIVNTEYGPVREKGQSPLSAPQITLHNRGIALESASAPQITLHNRGAAQESASAPQIALHNSGGAQESASAPRIALRNKGMDNDRSWIHIPAAGLSLLWPFLPSVFRQLQLTQDNKFLSRDMQLQAASCLTWFTQSWQDDEQNINSPLVLLLCGLTQEATSEPVVLNEATQAFLTSWLDNLPKALQGTWQKLSAGDIQQWFLQRPGWLSADDAEPVLHIAPASFDVLLNDWPWPVNMIALPWLEQPIKVLWDEPL